MVLADIVGVSSTLLMMLSTELNWKLKCTDAFWKPQDANKHRQLVTEVTLQNTKKLGFQHAWHFREPKGKGT